MSKSIKKNNTSQKNKTTKKIAKKSRKNVSENISEKEKKSSKSSIDTFNLELERIRVELQENYSTQKKLMDDMKVLLNKNSKEIKLKKNHRTKSVENIPVQSDFSTPQPVPPKLAKLLKIENENLSKTNVTKLLYGYLKENKLYNLKTKEITPNKQLKKLFSLEDDDVLDFYNLQSKIRKLYEN